MWFDTIWNTSLTWWLLAAVLVAGVIIVIYLRCRYKADPVKKHWPITAGATPGEN